MDPLNKAYESEGKSEQKKIRSGDKNKFKINARARRHKSQSTKIVSSQEQLFYRSLRSQ